MDLDWMLLVSWTRIRNHRYDWVTKDKHLTVKDEQRRGRLVSCSIMQADMPSRLLGGVLTFCPLIVRLMSTCIKYIYSPEHLWSAHVSSCFVFCESQKQQTYLLSRSHVAIVFSQGPTLSEQVSIFSWSRTHFFRFCDECLTICQMRLTLSAFHLVSS